MNTNFKWVSVSNEIAKEILEYKDKDEELMKIIQNAKEKMNQNPETKNGKIIEKIDGFSAMNILFTRFHWQNSDIIISSVSKEMGKEINLPRGKYEGIPKIHYTHIRLTNDTEDDKLLRKSLWDLFEICLKYSDTPNSENEKEFINKYNKAIKENQHLDKHFIKSLTVAMFICCPNTYIPLDVYTVREIKKSLNPKNNMDLIESCKDGQNYINLIHDFKNYINTNPNNNYKTIYELSAYSFEQNKFDDYTVYSAGAGSIENAKKLYNKVYYAIGWPKIGNLRNYKDNKILGEAIKQLAVDHPKDAKEALQNFKKLKKGDILILRTSKLVANKIRGATIYAVGLVAESFDTGYHFVQNIGHFIPVKWIKIYDPPFVEKDEYLDGTFRLLTKDQKQPILNVIEDDVLDTIKDIDLDSIKIDDLDLPTSETEITNDIDSTISETEITNYCDKNIILYGPPGTGKTYNSIRYAVDICNSKKDISIQELEENLANQNINYDEVKKEYDELTKEGRIAFTTFHQSYGYEDFIEGIKPVLDNKGKNDEEISKESKDIQYHIEDGTFKKFCEKAKEHTNQNYVFIIDEINRGNISKIFGELITLIESNKREGMPEALSTILPYSKKEFSIPSNVYILGTMNTADRSIAMMDTALRRRFKFIEKLPDFTLLPERINIEGKDINVSRMLEVINYRIEVLYDREHTIGHSFFMKLAKIKNPKVSDLKNLFIYEIIPLLQEYFYDDYSKIKLVLGNNFIIKNTDLNKKLFNADILKDTNTDLDEILENQYKINDEAFDNIENYIQIYDFNGDNNE